MILPHWAWLLPVLVAVVDAAELLFQGPEHANVLEFKDPGELWLGLRDAKIKKCDEAYLILLYSSWCPHCHAFAPIWTEIADSLHACHSSLKVGAFECVTEDGRRVYNDAWKNAMHVDLPEGMKSIGPRQICQSIVRTGFPTLLVIAPNSCQLEKASSKFSPIDLSEIAKFLSPHDRPQWRLWELSRPAMLTVAAAHIHESLEEAQLAKACSTVTSGAGSDPVMAMKALLDGELSNGPSDPGVNRWSDRAAKSDASARLRDAHLGFFHLADYRIIERHKDQAMTSEEFSAFRRLFLIASALFPGIKDQSNLLIAARAIGEWEGYRDGHGAYRRSVREAMEELGGIRRPGSPENIQSYTVDCETRSCTIWTLFHELLAMADVVERHKKIGLPDEEFESIKCLGLEALNNISDEQLSQWDVKFVLEQQPQPDFCVTGSAILQTMHDVIYLFLECAECREHFHEAFASCGVDRCTWASSAAPHILSEDTSETTGAMLWLWRFHNVVNVRTAFDKALLNLKTVASWPMGNLKPRQFTYQNEDVRWPSRKQCPECRKTEKSAFTLTAWALKDYIDHPNDTRFDFIEDYDLDAVAAFLRRYYTTPQWIDAEALVWDGHGFIPGSRHTPDHYVLQAAKSSFNGLQRFFAGSLLNAQVWVFGTMLVAGTFAGLAARWCLRYKLWRWRPLRFSTQSSAGSSIFV